MVAPVPEGGFERGRWTTTNSALVANAGRKSPMNIYNVTQNLNEGSPLLLENYGIDNKSEQVTHCHACLANGL